MLHGMGHSSTLPLNKAFLRPCSPLPRPACFERDGACGTRIRKPNVKALPLKQVRTQEWGLSVLGVIGTVLTPERVRIGLHVLPFIYLAGLFSTYLKGLRVDPAFGPLLVSDFFCFWIAGKAALSGEPALVYDNLAFFHYGGGFFAEEGFLHFFYPPTFLMMIAPLGLLPNIAAFLVFFAISLAGYALMGRFAWGGWNGALYLIALPTTLFAVFHGQNSLLLCALFGGALVALQSRRFVLAGILIGCLTVKPQLGILIPFALLAGRYWTVFAVASLTTIVLVLASWSLFGTAAWIAFLDQTVFARDLVGQEALPFELHVTLFTALQQIGVSSAVAIGVQAALTIFLIGLVAWVWRQELAFELKAVILSSAALLATPYLLSYDFALLAVPFIFLLKFARSSGLSAQEKLLFAVAIAIGSVAKIVNYNLGIPIGPLAPALLLALAFRQVLFFRQATDPKGASEKGEELGARRAGAHE